MLQNVKVIVKGRSCSNIDGKPRSADNVKHGSILVWFWVCTVSIEYIISGDLFRFQVCKKVQFGIYLEGSILDWKEDYLRRLYFQNFGFWKEGDYFVSKQLYLGKWSNIITLSILKHFCIQMILQHYQHSTIPTFPTFKLFQHFHIPVFISSTATLLLRVSSSSG